MPIEQYTYWSMTINNPDENDYLIVRNPNTKYVRELVWTPEVGEEGTPHIQAWVRLQRNQTLNFMKKLYPRGHFKHTDKDAYNENAHQYAQKNDDTTAGAHHIQLYDPLPAADSILYKVLEAAWDRLLERDEQLADRVRHEGLYGEITSPQMHLKKLWTEIIEREMIMERSGLEKIFVSPSYEKMKQKYWREIILRIKGHKQDADSNSTKASEAGGSQDGKASEVCEDDSGSEGPSAEGGSQSGDDDSSEAYASE